MTATPPTGSRSRRDHYLNPATGHDTEQALDQAIRALATTRGMWPADPAAALHAITSLHAETQQRIPAAVAAAREHGCSWAEIADLLGVTRASAWQRYAHPAATHTGGAKSDEHSGANLG